ncbi:MAG: DUF2206 domain-containing protein [Candidatus Methanofastidiosum sp.]|nr:DUF2206 domain-containing protein [Methanofastidiosum sp.]
MTPETLFLCSVPFLAILGTHIMNFYNENILLLLLIVLIATVVFLVIFDKIMENLYPFAVFIISISLLYHTALISNYIWGWDIQIEYYFANLVLKNSLWDMGIYHSYNSVLSVVVLSPIYAKITGMDLRWVYKIIYPLLYSMVPLGLYSLFQRQTSNKIAFLSVFFFMSFATFYTEVLAICRQQIAELFFVLIIILMVNKNMEKIKRSVLSIIFAFSLAVSHYGLSYIFMFSLIIVWFITFSMDNLGAHKLINRFYSKLKDENGIPNLGSFKKGNVAITSGFVLLFIAFTLTWYIYISGSANLNAIIKIGNNIVNSIFTDFLDPKNVEALRLALNEGRPTLLSQLHRVIQYTNQMFIVIGVLFVLICKRMKFERTYTVFSALNLIILFLCITVPFLSSSLNMTRMYHITLFFLAPFCILGGHVIFRRVSYWTTKRRTIEFDKKSMKKSLRVLSVYFVIFFFLQTGFVYQLVEGYSGSFALNNTKDYPVFNEKEILCANWSVRMTENRTIFADEYGELLLYSLRIDNLRIFPYDTIEIPGDSYLYFRTLNMKMGGVISFKFIGAGWKKRKIVKLTELVDDKNKIYDNGGAQLYYYDIGQ